LISIFQKHFQSGNDRWIQVSYEFSRKLFELLYLDANLDSCSVKSCQISSFNTLPRWSSFLVFVWTKLQIVFFFSFMYKYKQYLQLIIHIFAFVLLIKLLSFSFFLLHLNFIQKKTRKHLLSLASQIVSYVDQIGVCLFTRDTLSFNFNCLGILDVTIKKRRRRENRHCFIDRRERKLKTNGN